MTDTTPNPRTEPTVAAQRDNDQQGETLSDTALPDSYPQKPLGAFAHGTTEREMAAGEPLEEKLRRERPDHGAAPADVGGAGSLDRPDGEATLVAEAPISEPHADDSSQPLAPAPAEEAAMRIGQAVDAPGAVDRQAVIQRDDQ